MRLRLTREYEAYVESINVVANIGNEFKPDISLVLSCREIQNVKIIHDDISITYKMYYTRFTDSFSKYITGQTVKKDFNIKIRLVLMLRVMIKNIFVNHNQEFNC